MLTGFGSTYSAVFLLGAVLGFWLPPFLIFVTAGSSGWLLAFARLEFWINGPLIMS